MISVPRPTRADQAREKGPVPDRSHVQAPVERSVRSQTAEQQVKKVADDSNKTSNKTHGDSPYEGWVPGTPGNWSLR